MSGMKYPGALEPAELEHYRLSIAPYRSRLFHSLLPSLPQSSRGRVILRPSPGINPQLASRTPHPQNLLRSASVPVPGLDPPLNFTNTLYAATRLRKTPHTHGPRPGERETDLSHRRRLDCKSRDQEIYFRRTAVCLSLAASVTERQKAPPA